MRGTYFSKYYASPTYDPREVIYYTHITLLKVKMLVAQSCVILCHPMNCSLPGSSVHGTLQARILEWVAIPFSRWSSEFRDRTWVSGIASRFFTIWAMREALLYSYVSIIEFIGWESQSSRRTPVDRDTALSSKLNYLPYLWLSFLI